MINTELAGNYLKPGSLFFCKTPTQVTTLLGSCVSITMFNRRLGLGAINHGLLPECGIQDCPGTCNEGYRYVACSTRRMLQWFTIQGVQPVELEIKLFGGADVMSRSNGSSPGIGCQNITEALDVLGANGLNPLVRDVGGVLGRKIIFNTLTGEVLLKRLKGTFTEWISSPERRILPISYHEKNR